VSKGLLARKVGMTQVFTERGTSVPVTVLDASSCRVVQRKTVAIDGYDAVQLGYGDRSPKRTVKPMQGHFKRAGVTPLSTLLELRDAGEVSVGTRLTVDMFTSGQRIDVSGVSQGKGFSGTHKRHNFKRGPFTHGSHNIKQPGSIGSTDAARVFRGLRMAGHLGAQRATVRNLEVLRVDSERNVLLVKGAVPGHRNAVVLVVDSDRSATLGEQR
jgi:large subunit ribosomal protein L3